MVSKRLRLFDVCLAVTATWMCWWLYSREQDPVIAVLSVLLLLTLFAIVIMDWFRTDYPRG